jgi:hypothetical protein
MECGSHAVNPHLRKSFQPLDEDSRRLWWPTFFPQASFSPLALLAAFSFSGAVLIHLCLVDSKVAGTNHNCFVPDEALP